MVDLDQAGKDCDGVRVIREHGALSRFVEFYWIDDAKEGDPQGREAWRIVPDTSGHLLFHVFDAGGGEVDCSRLQVVGARSVFKDIDKSSRLLTVGVRFRPGSTSLFTGADADELTDRSLALTHLMGQVAVDGEDGLRRMALETSESRSRITDSPSSSRNMTLSGIDTRCANEVDIGRPQARWL